jgi:hypothetical protein
MSAQVFWTRWTLRRSAESPSRPDGCPEVQGLDGQIYNLNLIDTPVTSTFVRSQPIAHQ